MKYLKLLSGVLASFAFAASASAAVIYENGSLNGTFNADSISPPQMISDSFTTSSPAKLTGVTLGLWTQPGSQPATLNYSFGTVPFAMDIASGSATLSNVFAFNNGSFDVYLSSFVVDVTLGAGDYWLTLGDGLDTLGGPIFWDINFGPSQSFYRQDFPPVPTDSHYFVLNGDVTTGPGPNPQPVPEPASLLLLAAGMIGIAASRRRRSAAA
jgi:hypothetical protein